MCKRSTTKSLLEAVAIAAIWIGLVYLIKYERANYQGVTITPNGVSTNQVCCEAETTAE